VCSVKQRCRLRGIIGKRAALMTFDTRKLVRLGFALLIPAVLAACNTVEGAGQDIKSGGKAIEETARDAKN